jgi:hypothetical protein
MPAGISMAAESSHEAFQQLNASMCVIKFWKLDMLKLFLLGSWT